MWFYTRQHMIWMWNSPTFTSHFKEKLHTLDKGAKRIKEWFGAYSFFLFILIVHGWHHLSAEMTSKKSFMRIYHISEVLMRNCNITVLFKITNYHDFEYYYYQEINPFRKWINNVYINTLGGTNMCFFYWYKPIEQNLMSNWGGIHHNRCSPL